MMDRLDLGRIDDVAAELAVEHHDDRTAVVADLADESVPDEREAVVADRRPAHPVAGPEASRRAPPLGDARRRRAAATAQRVDRPRRRTVGR